MKWVNGFMGWWVALGLTSALSAEGPPKLEALRLDAFEPVAGEAVFRFPDGRLAAVDEGETVGETGAVLLEVLVDRVVLERDSKQPGIRETVWMFPAAERGKPSRLQIVSLVPPPTEDAPQPATETVPATASPPPP